MPTSAQLLERLDAIGRALEQTGRGLALIGLGSVGRELERLDTYSDLDFFAVVEDGAKAALIDDLGWLAAVAPIAFSFPNTADGHKLLFADGIFCEFAVLSASELASVAYAPGRVVWSRSGVPAAVAIPATRSAPPPRSDEWLIGEALTNLYVGLCRQHRGEILTAQRFIQQYAVDRCAELAARWEAAGPTPPDPFDPTRRVEQRLPAFAAILPQLVPGYHYNADAALAVLAFIEAHAPVNAALAQAIRELAGR